ncbi:MAG TPA: hypothetical protein VMW10_12885 [Alphaproteobacteria bacterium]|nr:hypothetical protein [Alphaproteobacteria bacterium]
MTMVKERWKDWECTCIKIAFQQKIQLKVTAFALGKSVNSVSKKIKKLGLRKPTTKSGRVKGDKILCSMAERTAQDLAKMRDLLQTYAPLKISQKARLSLQGGCWFSAPSLPKDLVKGECLETISQENASFSFSRPMDYFLSKDFMPEKAKREKKGKTPLYVPLHHVEKWAISEGFYQVDRNLQKRGLFFWKDGRYFSKAQLLVYVNRMRLDLRLQPLVLYEEDMGLYAEYSAC